MNKTRQKCQKQMRAKIDCFNSFAYRPTVVLLQELQ